MAVNNVYSKIPYTDFENVGFALLIKNIVNFRLLKFSIKDIQI